MPAVLVVLCGVATLALGACSSSGGSTGGGSGSTPTSTITVAIGSQNAQFGAFYVAQADGLFAKNHVNVKVSSYSAATTMSALLLSKKITIGITSLAAALEQSAAGTPTQIVFNTNNQSATADAIISAKPITTIDQLKSGSCKIASEGPGKGSYALMVAWLKTNGVSNCTQVLAADVPTEVAEVQSGSVQAATVSYSSALTAEKQGLVNFLYDPAKATQAQITSIFPKQYAAFGALGLTSQLSSNSAGVKGFVAGLEAAQKLINTHSNDWAGKLLLNTPAWKGVDEASIAASFAASRTSYPTGAQPGYISSADWSTSLSGFNLWGIPSYNAKASAVQYNKIVNMSYFQ